MMVYITVHLNSGPGLWICSPGKQGGIGEGRFGKADLGLKLVGRSKGGKDPTYDHVISYNPLDLHMMLAMQNIFLGFRV